MYRASRSKGSVPMSESGAFNPNQQTQKDNPFQGHMIEASRYIEQHVISSNSLHERQTRKGEQDNRKSSEQSSDRQERE